MKNPCKVSFFDLDHTLLKGNCGSLFFLYLIKKKILPLRSLFFLPVYSIKFTLFNHSLHELHQTVFNRFLRGQSFDTVKNALHEFLNKKLPLFWNDRVIALLKRAQHLGHYTVILSNSPSFLVQPIAQLLQVDDFRATEYSLDERGFFEKVRSILDGPQKAKYAKKLAQAFSLSRKDMTAYSDSYLDLPLLQAVAHPVAVNPDKRLLTLSLKERWVVL